jgi:RNA polymerase sigma-70 factor (ECF subfamily)
MDTDVTSQAYDAHHEQLYGYLVSITRDGDLAHDVVQEAYARLQREVKHQRAPREMRAWLFRVGRNLVIDRGRRQQLADTLPDRLRVESAGPSAEEECLVREARRELDVLLAQTSSDDRTALLMAAAGYSGAEIARAVGLSEGAVRTRMTRARGRLRMRLRPVS